MTKNTDAQFGANEFVLHSVVVKGFASEASLQIATGIPAGQVHAVLNAYRQQGLVAYREGRVVGWSATADGRNLNRSNLDTSLNTGAVQRMAAIYATFKVANTQIKELCTRWQLRSSTSSNPILNDHTDEAYDQGIIGELRKFHGSAARTCRDLGEVVERFDIYEVRLGNALAAIEAGHTEQFTQPLSDSYHDIWMELHQDLLLTLNLQRGEKEDA